MADAPPPSYEQATGSSSASSRPAASSNTTHDDHLKVPGASGKDGMSAAYRRSMEDEGSPLPTGWVRSYDPQNQHQFFVDTTKEPPRSIWHHPHDDDEYLDSLSGEQREQAEQESLTYKRNHPPTKEDYIHAPSDDEDDYLPQHYQKQTGNHASSSASNAELPPRPDGKDGGKGKEKVSFGRKLKDKVTGMSHEEREAARRQREEEERQAYEMHVKVRAAMQRAAETGQPQLIGRDREGRDIYMEPPRPPYAGGYGMGGGYGYNPYQPYNNQGIYTTPNARYIRPAVPYGRPYGGYGYGRPYGGGMAMPLAGGLLGGALLGGLLF
ncbi:hypothetical protein CKM354_001075700 [Cercospora kikuchii]|uniref:WW domain-containing protein n=1 Tax=Cercospora kikuchii TaxID=84275 RepID=A0A9P3FJX3_9PEZI|nr:uncharacterized protein CKM354_001075700 [Cercospora kikuchii]GIZ47672.1 hypothetical protein CKM354_001075700 [Cercospora kikuchii]